MLGLFLALLSALFRGEAAPAETSPPAPEARVIVVSDPAATLYYTPRTNIVRQMVETGLARFASTHDSEAAWRSLVSPTNVVGFKVTSSPGNVSGTRLSVGEALVMTLLNSGHPASKIIIWDKYQRDLDRAGWTSLARRLGVQTAGAFDAGWDTEEYFDYPLIGKPFYGELEFGQKGESVGRKSHVSQLITRRLDKIVNVTPVLNHNLVGVYGNITGLALATVDNTMRFEVSASQLEERLVEIYNLPAIADRILFSVTDALIAQCRGEEHTMLHYATALNQIRFSRDAVALDALALADIERGRARQPAIGERPVKSDLLTNAELLELGVAETNRIRTVYVRNGPYLPPEASSNGAGR